MIISFIEESHQRWDEHLHELVFAYNTAKQSSTGLSPALFNYGRQPAPLSSAFREQLIMTAEEQQDEAVKRWAERVQNVVELHKHAAEKSREEHERQAKYYNARRREATFQEGDQVLKRSDAALEGDGSREPRAILRARKAVLVYFRGKNEHETLRACVRSVTASVRQWCSRSLCAAR